MTTSPSGADDAASHAPAARPAAEPAGGYAPPTSGGPAPRRAHPGPFVRRGVPGGVVALVAAGTGAVGLVAGLAIGGATADGAAGTGPASGAQLTADLAVASTPASTGAADSAAGAPSGKGAGAERPGRQAARALAEGEGSRENPLPVGTPVSTGEWEVAVGSPREAWEEIRAENQFNGAPPSGMEYWIVPVTATYTGSDSGHAGTDVGVGFVGSDARTYSDMCGVVPDDLWDVDQVYGGGTAMGNVCVVVPAGADGLWTVTPGWSAEPVFFTGER